MRIEFIKGETRYAQGKRNDIYKRYKGYAISELGNGNGNWKIISKNDILIDGKSCREFVLAYYNRTKVTEKLYEDFRRDIYSGKIKIEQIFS